MPGGRGVPPIMPVFQALVLFGQGVQPPGGATTVKTTTHWAALEAQSRTVTVMGWEPGKTSVPAGGDCAQDKGPQLSVAHADRSAHKSGMVLEQATTVSGM